MDGSQRAIVTGVHCLQHIERFATAYLADNDTFRSHSQAVPHQVARGYFAFRFDVGRPCFQAYNVTLSELQLSRVFNCNDALGFRNRTAAGSGSHGVRVAGVEMERPTIGLDAEPVLSGRGFRVVRAHRQEVIAGQFALISFSNKVLFHEGKIHSNGY